MAIPGSRAPLQARNDLLSGLMAVYQSQRDAFDLEDLQALLKWLDVFVRYPLGADDVTPVPGVLPPIQKAALAALGQVCSGTVTPAAAWPDMLRTLAGLLCPFRAAQQRRAEAEAAAAAAAADVAAVGGGGSGGMGIGRLGSTGAVAAGTAASVSSAAQRPPSPMSPVLGGKGLTGAASFGPGRAALISPRSLTRLGRWGIPSPSCGV